MAIRIPSLKIKIQLEACSAALAPLARLALQVGEEVQVALVQVERDAEDVGLLVEEPGGAVAEVRVEVQHRHAAARALRPQELHGHRSLVQDAAAVGGVPPRVPLPRLQALVAAVVVAGRAGEHQGPARALRGLHGPLHGLHRRADGAAGGGLRGGGHGRGLVAVEPDPALRRAPRPLRCLPQLLQVPRRGPGGEELLLGCAALRPDVARDTLEGTKVWAQVATQMIYSYTCLETDTNANTPAYDHSGTAWSFRPFAKCPFHPLRMPSRTASCSAAGSARARHGVSQKPAASRKVPRSAPTSAAPTWCGYVL